MQLRPSKIEDPASSVAGAQRVAVAWLILVAWIAPAVAQEAPAGSLLETLGVRVVNVGVLVTNKSGAPVDDLSVDDFELREDGKRVEISHFSGPTSSAREAEAAGPEGYVVLLVDHLATSALSRRRVLDGARRFVDSHADSGLQVAIASYDGYLNVRQTFTRDREALYVALEGLEGMSSLGLARRATRWAELRNQLETLRQLSDLALSPARSDDTARHLSSYSSAVRSYADRVGQQTGSVLYSISHMVNALGALPGRKALVYVSEGLPMRPGEEFLVAAHDVARNLGAPEGLEGNEARHASVNNRSAALGLLSDAGSAAGSRDKRLDRKSGPGGLRQLTATANANRVSLYTLKSDSFAGGVPAEFAGDVGALLTPGMQSSREANMFETLQLMAAHTGGDARSGTAVDNLMERARHDLRELYSLGFSPTRAADNEFHELDVKVKRKKVEVRARNGYVDKTIGAKLADRATSSLLLGMDDNPHGVAVQLGAVRDASDADQVEAILVLEIPMRDLVLAEVGGVWSTSTQLFVAARDAQGAAAPVQAMGLRIETDESLDERPDQVFRGQLPLLLRRQSQRVGIAFVDPNTGMASFVSTDLELGSS